MSECTKCALHINRTNIVWGIGPTPCDVMLIGEAPGQNEDLLGKPFVGASGNFLNEALKEAGYSRDDVYITNVVKCRPPYNRNPRMEEEYACKIHLIEELIQVSPKKIISLGLVATRNFIEAKSLSLVAGRRFTISGPVGSATLIPCYHPAYALHSPSVRKLVKQLIIDALTS